MSILKKKKHKQYKSEHVAYTENTDKPIEQVPLMSDPIIDIRIDEQLLKELEQGGFKKDWLMSMANRYNFTKIEYMDKFKGFRCYQAGKMVDTITANDLASLNSNPRLTTNGIPFRHLDKSKQVINIPWRK